MVHARLKAGGAAAELPVRAVGAMNHVGALPTKPKAKRVRVGVRGWVGRAALGHVRKESVPRGRTDDRLLATLERGLHSPLPRPLAAGVRVGVGAGVGRAATREKLGVPRGG